MRVVAGAIFGQGLWRLRNGRKEYREVSMRVFLTGATGVVGRRLVSLLLNAGHEVTAAVRSSVARAELTTKGVRAIEVNLFDSAGGCLQCRR